MLTQIEGQPAKGMRIRINSWAGQILDVGINATDGQSVSSRSCLTGQPAAPYGSILIPHDAPKLAYGDWVICEVTQDVQ